MRFLISYFGAALGRITVVIQRLGRLFATMILLSFVGIWLLFAGILYESYASEQSAAKVFVNNVDSLVELDIARNIEFYDLSLKAAATGFLNPDIMKLSSATRQLALFDQSANASGLGSILILDATGKVVADSRSEVPSNFDEGYRADFNAQINRPSTAKLVVGHPFQSQLNPDIWAFSVSRRIDHPDGSLAGVALGTLQLSYFMHLFGTVEMPAGSTITILHDDGTILMRMPFVDIGRNMSKSEIFRRETPLRSGLFTSVSTIDGIERLFGFRQISGLPMRLVVGVPTSHFIELWRWRAAFMALGFAILSGLIIGLAVTLGSELHRRTLAEQALLELAATDSLTGLPNRRSFDDSLENEWARAVREGTSAALLMIDCDFFKAYNDAYGHLQGDQGLRAIAGALRDTIQRPADLVARFGGEEFVILLPGTDLDGALRVAETVRAAVARLAWPHARSPFGKLTVSIGIAACLPTNERDALSLVQAADFALYEAKERGRNQTATGERLDLTAFGWRAAG